MRNYLSKEQGALASFCGGLLIFLTYQAIAPVSAYDIPVVGLDRPLPKPATAPAFMPASVGSFWEVDARPVFSPSRTPVKIAETAAKDPAAPPEFTASLVGVIIDGSTRIALLRSSATTFFGDNVGVGGTVQGWQVTEIDPDKIVVRFGTVQQEIPLNAARNKAASGQGANQSGAPSTDPAQPQLGATP